MSDESQVYTTMLHLPPGAVPQHSVAVVAYFAEDGTTRYALGFEGDCSLASVLGLLDLAKAHVIAESGWSPG